MSDNPVRETAQIIPFTARKRGGKGLHRESTRQNVERLPVAVCDFGSGWYHEAAMQEEAGKLKPH